MVRRADDGGELIFATAAVNVPADATTVLVAAPAAGKSIWVYGLVGTGTPAGTIKLIDATPTDHTGVMPVADNGGFVIPEGEHPWVKCAAAKALQIVTATTAFDGILIYAIHTD